MAGPHGRPDRADGSSPAGGRGRLRSAIRIVLVLWAIFWVGGGLGATARDLGQVSIVETFAMLIFFLGFALGPLASHIWYARTHPLGAAPSPAVHPGAARHGIASHGPQTIPAPRSDLLLRLDHIAQAADELVRRGWISQPDRQGIAQRLQRLEGLVLADERSVAHGGTRSPVIRREIDQLGARVVGLLDAAIDSAVVAPGDSDLDARLQAQLEALHARGQAVTEVEGFQQ